MKKIKITEKNKQSYAHLIRFLKDNDYYNEMIYEFKESYGIETSMLEIIKEEQLQMIDYITDLGISFYYSRKGKEYWYEVDDKWLIYLYEHNLFGQNYTCSKKILMERIFDSIQSTTSFYIEQKLKEICIKENYKVKYI